MNDLRSFELNYQALEALLESFIKQPNEQTLIRLHRRALLCVKARGNNG